MTRDNPKRGARVFVKTWWVAVRPFAYPAGTFPVLLGAALAAYAGYPLHWGLLIVTWLGVECFHTSANLLNDRFDYARGLDTEVDAMSGAIVRGMLSERQVFRGAMLFLAVGVACGFYLVWQTGWMVLVLGVAGAVCALGYTGPKWCFKYVGLGDAVIFAAFGPLPVFGTYWVQTRAFGWLPLIWSVPVGALIVALLHANNWFDWPEDAAKGCRTLASRLGDRGSAIYYRALILGAFVLVLVYYAAGKLWPAAVPAPATVFITLLAAPVALPMLRASRERDAVYLGRLDGETARLHLVFFGLLTAAFFIAACRGCALA